MDFGTRMWAPCRRVVVLAPGERSPVQNDGALLIQTLKQDDLPTGLSCQCSRPLHVLLISPHSSTTQRGAVPSSMTPGRLNQRAPASVKGPVTVHLSPSRRPSFPLARTPGTLRNVGPPFPPCPDLVGQSPRVSCEDLTQPTAFSSSQRDHRKPSTCLHTVGGHGPRAHEDP